LQPALAQAGLRPTQPTLTMVATADQLLAARPVAGGNLPKGPQAVVLQLPTEAWRTVYLGEGFDPVDGAHRVRALGRAVGSVYAQSSPNGDLASGVVATGVGSFGHGWLGVHGMRTLPPHRGRGHASSILRALALEAHRRGVARAYLQVEEANAGARRLYESLGFVAAWRYHYWRPGA
jgi:GNAT superfamily N-acetyltransferase